MTGWEKLRLKQRNAREIREARLKKTVVRCDEMRVANDQKTDHSWTLGQPLGGPKKPRLLANVGVPCRSPCSVSFQSARAQSKLI